MDEIIAVEGGEVRASRWHRRGFQSESLSLRVLLTLDVISAESEASSGVDLVVDIMGRGFKCVLKRGFKLEEGNVQESS
jgi:hypothetical protein